MSALHPKGIRRQILLTLYGHFQNSPLDMLAPDELRDATNIGREHLTANAHYLHDRGLIELMIGYSPTSFAAARITADGIDLVENEYQLNLLFPGVPGEMEESMAEMPILVERLVQEADFSPLDGERRKCLLRDVQFLRDELARPAERWRPEVIEAVLGWIDAHFQDPDDVLPSLAKVRALLSERPRA